MLSYGQRVEFDARVRPTPNFNNPGEFDYVHCLARQGIFWTASARAGSRQRQLTIEAGKY